MIYVLSHDWIMNNEWNMNWDYEWNIDWDINCINMVIH